MKIDHSRLLNFLILITKINSYAHTDVVARRTKIYSFQRFELNYNGQDA